MALAWRDALADASMVASGVADIFAVAFMLRILFIPRAIRDY
jgi:hypothetical protein